MLLKYDNASKNHNPSLANATAAVVTIAAFAKLFLPFYLIGSTGIFAAMSVVGAVLVAASWRCLIKMGAKVGDILLLALAFYGLIAVNFHFLSSPTVPITHLIGILIFHFLFMGFGFAAARGLKAVQMVLLGGAAIYLIVIVQHVLRFGDVMEGGNLRDIFGVGYRSVPTLHGDQPTAIFVSFHQQIGELLGLAALAAFGLARGRMTQLLAFCALTLVLLLTFHIAARGALIALVGSLVFLATVELWRRSRKLALISAIAVVVAVALASGLFYAWALQDKNVDPAAPDAISRTIRELQSHDPGFRLAIWQETWDRIVAEPNRLLFGRGIGMYPVNEGVGAPDWLLRPTMAAHVYPHNVDLELLYETGIAGLLIYGVLTLFPLGFAINRWHLLSLAERSVILMYVFQLVGDQFSGSFAYSYPDQFFFAMTVGIMALQRMRDLPVGITDVAVVDYAPATSGQLNS